MATKNFISSTYQVTLFKSVIPSDVPRSAPLSGMGSPESKQRAVPGQLYTQTESGQVWCKGTTASNTGWFRVASNAGHPTVIVGAYNQTNPNNLVTCPGPAVWYGSNRSIWVKTDSANDSLNWNLLLEFSISVGNPDYYSFATPSDENLVE